MTNNYNKLHVFFGMLLLVLLPMTVLSCPFLVAINGGCLTDAECAGENKLCNKNTGECYFQCETDDNCSGDALCVADHCIDNPCTAHGQYDADSGTCTCEPAYCGDDCGQNLCPAHDNQLIKDQAQGLTWTRCPFRERSYPQAPTPDCNASDSFAAFSYCTDYGNICNGGQPDGVLNSTSSQVWVACHDLNFAGFTDWRVPTSEELRNLAGNDFKDSVFDNLGSEGFLWSSESSSTFKAIAVKLQTAEQRAIGKSETESLRCVRGL